MTIKTISDSERDPSQSPDAPQSRTGAAVDRLAELLPAEALEDALKGLEPDDITGRGGLLTQLAGRVIETALGAELTEHLGHPPGGVAQGSNVRNGAGPKTVATDLGPVEVRTPRPVFRLARGRVPINSVAAATGAAAGTNQVSRFAEGVAQSRGVRRV